MKSKRLMSVQGVQRADLRSAVVFAAGTVVESLESRRLLCSDGDEHGEVLSAPLKMPANPASVVNVVRDHAKSWYKAAKKVTLTPAKVAAAVKSLGATDIADAVADPVTFATNAAGLPLLTSRSDGVGLKVFIDFDGYADSSVNDAGFSTDADLTTFNTAEQAVIYSTWRDIVSYYSMLNVNITTVQPATGGSNQGFIWQRITNSRDGGAAYVGWIVNDASHGYNSSNDALGRHSGIAHEIGHQIGLDHQSNYDNAGNKTAEYTGGIDSLHGPIMGVDYNGNVKKFYNGRDTYAADSIQDDLYDAAATISRVTGLNGYKPDDFTGTSIGTATTLSLTNGSYQTAGVISTIDDADWFSFTSAGGSFAISALPTYESALAPKLELYNAGGTLLGSIDDTLYRYAQDNASEDLNFTLSAGTYFAKVSSHGDYGDQGEYAFYASQLPAGWASVDVNRGNTGQGGYVTYDPSTGGFLQGGSGADIWTTSDAFRYSYQTLTGDGSITARVDRLDNTAGAAKAGVMIRQSGAFNAAHVYFGIKPSGELETIRRTSTGATAANITGTGGQVGPWVRLTRAGNLFTLSKSTDGTSWTVVTTTTVTMTGPVMIGLATNANNFNALTTSAFSNVSVTGNLGVAAPTYNGLAAPTGLTAAAVATQSTGMALAWNDVTGETGYSVERSLDNINFSGVATVGANVTTYTDTPSYGSMRYWYRVTALTAGGYSAYSNAVSVVNKPGAPFAPQVIKINPTKLSISWRDVAGDLGYRVERSTDGGASYITLATTPQNINIYNSAGLTAGITYTYRITPVSAAGDGVPLLINATTQLAAPATVSLTNLTASSATVNWAAVTGAATYNIYRSLDNVTFTLVGTATTTSYVDGTVNPLTNYYYYVTAVGGDGAVGVASATVKGSTAPATPLPTPWLDADIGSVAGTGDAGGGGGAFTVNTSGADIANPDSFHFVYQPITGNTTITTRVASLGVSDNAAKAGLMIRQNLTSATAPYAGIFMNAGGGFGIDVRSRSTAGGNYTYGQALANVAAPYWLRLSRAGNVFTMSYSADGVSWTTATTRAVSMTGTVYVGLATTAFSASLMNTATFTGVNIASAAPTVATTASASPNPVTGKTTALSVLGADDGGEANLTYAWSATGPGTVTYSANNTNAAKSAVATFSKAGTYTITATITDGGFNAVTSSVTVVVNQTLTGIAAENPTMVAGFAQQISAVDQFGDTMSIAGIAWAATTGSISPAGVYVAPAVGASTVTITGTLNATNYTTAVGIVSPRTWYKADNTGATLVDSSGNNYTATLTGSYTQSAVGRIGNAVTLSGGNAVAPAAVFNGLNDFTVSAWVRPTATTNWGRLFDFGTGTNTYMFLAPADGSGYVRFAITTGGGGGEKTITSSTTLANNVWSHLAVTLSGNVATLFVNGVAVGTNAAMTLNPASLGATTLNYLGKSQYADPTFKGGIDDFRVYGAGLSASNVAALYNAGVASATSAPGSVTATAASATVVNVAWTDNAGSEVGYLVERSTNAAFTAGLVSFNVAANAMGYADTTAAASTTYYYRVTALLSGGTPAGPVAAPAVTTPAAAVAPTISSFVINDGSAQRSMVTSMTLTFDSPVTLGGSAITLWRRATAADTPTEVTGFTLTPSAGNTVFTLTFPAGAAFVGGSLADGLYEVRVAAAAVTGSGGTTMTANAAFTAYRLFGDIDASHTVDFSDFLVLQTAYRSTFGTAAFVKGLDSDGNDVIDFNDFLALQTRYGQTL